MRLGSWTIWFRTSNTKKNNSKKHISLFEIQLTNFRKHELIIYFYGKQRKGTESLLCWALTYILFVHNCFLVNKRYVPTQYWKTRKKELGGWAFYALGLQNYLSPLCSWCYVSISAVYRTARKTDNSCGFCVSGSISKYRLPKKLF